MNTILLVEDSESIVMGLKYSLEQEGFRVTSAKTIAEAEVASNYDLILLDITLPDGNGFDFFKEVKKKKTYQ